MEKNARELALEALDALALVIRIMSPNGNPKGDELIDTISQALQMQAPECKLCDDLTLIYMKGFEDGKRSIPPEQKSEKEEV